MTTKEFCDKLNDTNTRTTFTQALNSLMSREKVFKEVYNTINSLNSCKDLTVEQMYNLRKQLIELETFSGLLNETIKDSELTFLGEFEDTKMSLSELGISSKNFICTKGFKDPFSDMSIKEGTEIEIDELLYANISNGITVCYTELKTENSPEKLVEIFKNGKQKTILTLKILEEFFNPLEK
ncbi:hypothetical protein [Flammeovirga sp. EKP202]|uniref:hypothetical protein n=1 Tax=Flammeovirga sp. EKP202 TaxID=2770592 RepID=UPI00165ED87F|nr:hypothetical protein [Flammeovirga sp. EKP202]MBD0399986.1 hypothetical protein [Flammeovirga sp. EKP202]